MKLGLLGLLTRGRTITNVKCCEKLRWLLPLDTHVRDKPSVSQRCALIWIFHFKSVEVNGSLCLDLHVAALYGEHIIGTSA